MSITAKRGARATSDATTSNTNIVLAILANLGGHERLVDIEDLAEAAWQAVPARFSWPRHQQYPDLDAVDVTLRAAKKNEQLVTGSKKEGWMLTTVGVARVEQHAAAVQGFISEFGNAGRMENRRERGGLDSASARRLEQLHSTKAAVMHRAGQDDQITVYDFLAFFGINQYMPDRKYASNRQAVENLIRGDDELMATAQLLHNQFGSTYKTLLTEKDSANDRS
jgi:hypothetical protein